jgi:hypothetical protein
MVAGRDERNNLSRATLWTSEVADRRGRKGAAVGFKMRQVEKEGAHEGGGVNDAIG